MAEALRMRAATYNVLDPGFGTLAPWPERRENVVATIEAAAPGILALQEADYTPLARELDLPADLAASTGLALSPVSSGGTRLLYDGDVWSADDFGVVLLPRSHGDHRRSAIWQRFTTSGRAVLVVATHLSYGRRSIARARQARAIVRFLGGFERMPTIVAGDLNSRHGGSRSTPMEVLARAGYADVAPALAELDHIAVSREVRVRGAALEVPELPGPASDHALLWADLAL